jgi:hypothetical protein
MIIKRSCTYFQQCLVVCVFSFESSYVESRFIYSFGILFYIFFTLSPKWFLIASAWLYFSGLMELPNFQLSFGFIFGEGKRGREEMFRRWRTSQTFVWGKVERWKCSSDIIESFYVRQHWEIWIKALITVHATLHYAPAHSRIQSSKHCKSIK